MSDIELRLFRYFVALAEERHFARAALRLKITPPTLTHQIKKLESELGAKLVMRKGNTLVTLTDAGQRLLASAQQLLRQAEETAQHLRRLCREFLPSPTRCRAMRSTLGTHCARPKRRLPQGSQL